MKFKLIPKYGDLMTIEAWIGYVKDGCFTDYDGSGVYAFKDKISDKGIRPSDVKKGKIDKTFTHIVWFNK